MKVLEFMVGVKKGSCGKVLEKREILYIFFKRMVKSSVVEGRIKHPSKVRFSTGKLHIVTEMVSMVQRKKEFWTVLSITSEEQKLCSATNKVRENLLFKR